MQLMAVRIELMAEVGPVCVRACLEANAASGHVVVAMMRPRRWPWTWLLRQMVWADLVCGRSARVASADGGLPRSLGGR